MNYRLGWIVIHITIYFSFASSLWTSDSDVQDTSVARVQSSSGSFCLNNRSPNPLSSIVVDNVTWVRSATLRGQNGGYSPVISAEIREKSLIFNNPPLSACYILDVSSRYPIDMNKLNVQLNYGPARSVGSGYDYGGNTYNPGMTSQNSNCGPIICRNGGICQNAGMNRYQCRCDSTGQWLGADCSLPNPCIQSPCANGGQCYYLPDAKYYCVCRSGFTGSDCQTSLSPTYPGTSNPCMSSRPCLNGGMCWPSNNQGGYVCICPQGYTGANCESSGYLPGPTGGQSGSCGRSSLPTPPDLDRIVGGKTVTEYSWPWIVSIQTMYGGQHFCGGTLVDAYHVITAAHCFDGIGTNPRQIKIVVGLLKMATTNDGRVQQLAVAGIFRHEGYSSRALVNDITVIKLRTPARFTEFVSPICLPSGNGAQDPQTNQDVLIAGWGYTDSGIKKIAPQLQQAKIQALDINGDAYGGPGCSAWMRRGYTIDNRKQICAMSLDGRRDSCQGDSGGPLIGAVGKQWYLFGIVSYGDSVCASSTAAGVYTRVSGYASWIQQKLQL